MDFFEQFMLEELENIYANDNLEIYEYEDVYERFTHLDYLEEVKPYIYAMRFLGRGTVAEPDTVFEELEGQGFSSPLIRGLYLDIKLIMKKGSAQDIEELNRCVASGYSNKFLRDVSYIAITEDRDEVEVIDEPIDDPVFQVEDEKVKFKSMIFEGCGYSGLYFTSGDIDYLNAKVFIEPVKQTRHLSVRSQIYAGDEPFSKVFSNDYTLKPGDEWFTTTGWGNKNFNCYGNRVYRWIVEFDGDENDTHSQEFRFYSGKIQQSGVPIKDVKLFSSKASGALEVDRDRYSTSFDKNDLEYVYFRLFINEPGTKIVVQRYLKIICLEDGSTFYDDVLLQPLEADWVSWWSGVGFKQKGKWKQGLYKYSIRLGTGPIHEGTFTVY